MKNNHSYTIAKANQDFLKLLPYLSDLRVKNEVLTTCVVCLANLDAKNRQAVITNDQTGVIGIRCHQCSPEAEWNVKAKYSVMPNDEALRITTIQGLRSDVINEISAKVGFPIVSRPLFCDAPTHQAILFTDEKVLSSVVQWNDEDPLIISGLIADQSLAVYHSVNSGKTQIEMIMGNLVIHTSDQGLADILARGEMQ